MKVSVAVMAHPARAHHVADLADRLDVAPTIVWDRWGSKWDTGRRSLLAADMSADYHCVIQDDGIVCRDFTAGLAAALEYVPDGHPVAAYFGARRPLQDGALRLMQRARDEDARWIVWPSSPMWGVALAIPTGHVRAVVKHGDTLRTPSYDGRVRHWYRRVAKRAVWHPVPSLVDHRDGPDNPSLVTGRHSDGRRAHWFIGADASPLDVDWSGGVVRAR